MIYPFMKRITYWPQAWLSIAANFGAVVAWVAVTNEFDIQLLALLTGAWAWTMHLGMFTSVRPGVRKKAADGALDTIYACQDRRDDVKVGIKSTAVLLGDFVRPFTFSCAVLFVAAIVYAGILNGQTSCFFYISVGGTSLHLIWQFMTLDLDSPASCWRELSSYMVPLRGVLTRFLVVHFTRNGHLGWVTLAGLMIDYLYKIDKLPFGVTLPFRS